MTDNVNPPFGTSIKPDGPSVPGPSVNQDPKKALRSLLLAGILPVIAFTVIEDQYGTVWGIIAGMVFGGGEILWEWQTQKKVQVMTWAGNALLFILGGISLFSQEGYWYKMQPAIIEALMAIAFLGSWIVRKPILLVMAKAQGQMPPPVVQGFMSGITARVGVFLGAHALLAAWAAIHWSTAQWALLKGVGFTVSFIVYLLAEVGLLRMRIKKSFQRTSEQPR